MAGCRFEIHHRIPRCLLGFHDRFVVTNPPNSQNT
jgi:hypothetical protein